MTTYARVAGGIVVEIITPPNGVSIADLYTAAFVAELVDVTAVSPQPAQGWSYSGSIFTAPPAPPAPTQAQLAAVALAAGVAIVSTGTPALSGTYPLDPATQQKVAAISLYIQVNGKFPAAQTTFSFPDQAGQLHAFPTTAEFQAVATALADHATAIDLYAMGVLSSLPASPVTIA